MPVSWGIGRTRAEEALRRGAKTVYAGTRGPLQIADELSDGNLSTAPD